jgi:glycosyltransferase involved in cell wall biosynthesis
MKVSLVIPVYNEADNISRLSSEISTVMGGQDFEWECIWIDDASLDSTWTEIKKLHRPHQGIRLNSNCGQTTATKIGIEAAKFEFIVTLDGDGQNDPNDILDMMDIMVTNPNLDMVQGYRLNRSDNKFFRTIPSKIANRIVRFNSNHNIIDLGCSLRLFKKDLMGNLILTGEMHRLFSLYLADNGAKISQVKVTHRPRISGKSKYGLGRILKLSIDILLYRVIKVVFISPIYTFGKFAMIGYLLAFSLILGAFLLKIFDIKAYIDGTLVSTSIIIFATSTLFIGLGILAEMLTRVSSKVSNLNGYSISEKHNV